MGGKLAGRAAAFHIAPADAVVLAGFINLDNAQGHFGINRHVAEELAGPGYQEEFPRQIRHAGADGLPIVMITQAIADRLHLMRLNAVGQVAAVSFMPALFVSLLGHVDKGSHKSGFQNLHLVFSFILVPAADALKSVLIPSCA